MRSGYIFGSWGVCLEALGAILERLGQKLGYLWRSWRQVGTLLAGCWGKDGEDEPRKRTSIEKGWLKAMNGAAAAGIRARVGGCLELEFRDLEGLDGLDTRSNTPWRLPSAGAGGYPVRCARQATTVPNLRLEIEESCLKNQSNSVQNSRKNR